MQIIANKYEWNEEDKFYVEGREQQFTIKEFVWHMPLQSWFARSEDNQLWRLEDLLKEK